MDTENSTKCVSCIRVHFRISYRLELQLEEKQISGALDGATVLAKITEIEIPNSIITESMDTKQYLTRSIY